MANVPSASSDTASLPPSSAPSQPSGSSPTRTAQAPSHATERIPPPKKHSSSSGKLQIGKTKSRPIVGGRYTPSTEIEDDWTLEGGGSCAAISSRSGNGDVMTPPTNSSPLLGSQLTEVPSKEEKKKGRGRGLAKKTSQLFSRNKDKESGTKSPETGSSLHLPVSSRQNSHSSVTSGESTSTSNSSRNPFATRGSNSSRKSPRSSHSRRLSQDSSASWHNPPRTVRSGSTSTYESPSDLHAIPQRQSSNLSASVPTLTRQSMPPIPSDSNGTIPFRMSNWFSHLLPSTATSSTPLSQADTSSAASPRAKSASAAASFLNAARQRAVDGVRLLLDSEARPDECPDPMWVMGVPHPGWRPSTPVESPSLTSQEILGDRRGSSSSEKPSPPRMTEQGMLKPATWKKKDSQPTSSPSKGFGNLFTGSTLSLALPATINGSPNKEGGRSGIVESPSRTKKAKAGSDDLKWPDQFYDDFRSRVWCSYRSQYAPIVSLPPALLIPSPDAYYSAFGPPADLALPQANASGQQSTAAPVRLSSSPWTWSRTEAGLTSDAGWGCMLRTGQSMLANALVHLHLGRDWRLPPSKPSTTPSTPSQLAELEAYATYVKILSWFMDDPSPLCPFSVHRMALIGKELGKEVGEWFGPSTASGALKTLSNSFPLCGLAVATATDSMVYKSDVIAASKLPSDGWSDDKKTKQQIKLERNSVWGSKAVLVLVGVRLGLDGVNPIYHESVKTLFTFPQSVGIAGGRPSSSYYFVASQANSLFYLDPHFTRPAIPLEIPPAPAYKESAAPTAKSADRTTSPYTLDVVDVDDMVSSDTASETSSPPSRRRHRRTASQAAKRLSHPPSHGPLRQTPATPPRSTSRPVPISDPFALPEPDSTPRSEPTKLLNVDPRTMWYANAYPEAGLRSFHCDKVRKLPLSGLDPSMLLGFLITNENDFEDFCERVHALPQKIFTVQDEPPVWDDDDETGLESVSEPDMDDLADDIASTNLNHGDVPGTTSQPVDIVKRNDKAQEDEWEGDMSTPGTKGEGVRSWEGIHSRRPPPVPLVTGDRSETESWVRPGIEGEAPNGGNVL